MQNVDESVSRILRGTTHVVSEGELREKLKKGRPLRVKLGVDPTAPDIHLGHTVVLSKLKTFQDLGHTVVFIIGDFTAAIGDPSGRDTTRPPLSEQMINDNIQTYTDQVFKVLNKDKTEVRYNGEWLYDLFDRSNPAFMPKTILRNHTVQQLMERDDFAQRRKAGQPISLLELMYPLFQGYDSVAVKADVELGGHDQLFNLLMGRQMQKDAQQEPQVVLTLPLLEGLDGVRKMSKSYGNHVGVKDPQDQMFGKLMSISDQLMWKYFELLTEENLDEVKKLHPMEAKKHLAGLVVTRFHGEGAGKSARENFEQIFSKKENPDEMEEFRFTSKEMDAVELIVAAKLASSKNEARRLVEQGGVQLDGQRVNLGEKITVSVPGVLKVGKRKFKKLIPL
ncbi:MAG: Tyrosine--tRNA ligase [Elusimicrobia bacterium]|nr:Tyrosine--tRNA ligase [Elusimicrobiota bacterium]